MERDFYSIFGQNNFDWKKGLIFFLILIFLGFLGAQHFNFRTELQKKVIETASLREKIGQLEEEIEKLKLPPAGIIISIPEKGEVLFTKENQEIGQMAENLKIKSIRTGEHLKFFRIVFDIKKLDDSNSENIPKTQAIYLSEKPTIEIKISGMGGDLEKNPAIGKQVEIRNQVIASYFGEIIEENFLKYTINLKKEENFFLHFLSDPARIILDIQK